MKKRKIVRLLSILSEKEAKRLILFLQSPFFNTNKRLIALGQFLLTQDLNAENLELTEEECWEAISPGEPFNQNQIRFYSSKLVELVEQFIFFTSNEEDQSQKLAKTAHYYLEKKAHYFLEQAVRNQEKEFEKIQPKTIDDYYWKYQNALVLNNFRIQKRSLTSNNIDAIQNQLNDYSITEQLRMASFKLQITGEIKKDKDLDLFWLSFKIARQNPQNLSVLGRVWLHTLSLQMEPNSQEKYMNLKGFFTKHIDQLDPNTCLLVSVTMENHVRRVFPNDRKSYMEQLFSLYMLSIEQGWLKNEDAIHHSRFNNIVFVALSLSKYDWAEKFIQDYSSIILPDYRETICSYNLARVDFARGNYRSCLKRTLFLENIDPVVNVGTKRLQLKAYYELKDFEALDSGLNSLRVFVHRIRGVSENYKTHHNSFVNLMASLFKVSSTYKEKEHLEKLLEELEATPNIPEQDWLIEKVKGLLS